MPTQEIIWTVLPNGIDRDAAKLKLSVFVSPRLRFEGTAANQTLQTLDAFPDFIDWPKRLASGQLAIDLIVDDDAGNPRPTTIVTQHPPESNLWKAIFTQQTQVVSHAPGLPVSEPVSTYPASAIANGVTEGYKTLGEKSPYRSGDDRSLAESFASIHRALIPNGAAYPANDGRPGDVDAIPETDLKEHHRQLSETLLRPGARSGFAEKLATITAIAGRRARLNAERREEKVPLILDSDESESAFAQFAAFHRRVRRDGGGARRVDAVAAEPVKDFHEILASLGEYGDLLRRLGLVIDLEVPLSRIPESRHGQVRHLRAAPRFANVSATDDANAPTVRFKTPVTKYLFSQTPASMLPMAVFCAAPHGSDQPPDPAAADKSEITAGLLNLGLMRPDDPLGQTPQYSLLQVDFDGAGLKLLNALEAIVADSGGEGLPIDRTSSGAPALRTSGLSLVRAKFAQGVMADIDRADRLEASAGGTSHPVLFAEDLVRGYRIDVRRFERDFHFGDFGSTSHVPWLSLHKRKGRYTIPRQGGAELNYVTIDEGFVQPALAQDAGPARAVRPLYVSEALLQWQGWSLSSPPPATPLDTAPLSPSPRVPAASTRPTVDFEPVPNSLPRLRFGHFYQLRARTVDLAGNGLTVEEADGVLKALEENHRKQPIFPPGSDDFFFRRFDPIPAPALVLRQELTEGEAQDTLVIRSNDGLSPEAYAATLGDSRYSGVSERHVVPPRTSQRMGEMHGTFEPAFGANGDPARFHAVCAKEGGTLEDTHIMNVTTGLVEPLPDMVDLHSGDRIPFGLKFADVPGGSGRYAIHCEAKLLLPYLPDPLARGAALFGLSGVDGKTGRFDDLTNQLSYAGTQVLPTKAHRALGFVTKIGFGRDWPGRLPFLLQLSGRSSSDAPQPLPQWDIGARLLKVELPPGQTATVWLSSYPGAKDIDLFGLYYWWNEHVGSSAERKEFLNTAEHGALAMLSPARQVLLVHAVQKPVRLALPSPSSTLDIRRFGGDSMAYFGGTFRIHGPSTAKLDLWASWEEPGEQGGPPRKANVHVLELPIQPAGISEDAASQAEEKPIATYAAGAADSFQFKAPPQSANPAMRGNYRAKQDFGDTKHRKVTYTLTATSRYVEYFPKRITSDPRNITRSIAIEENILSSAKPAAPEIANIIPILKRQEIWDLSDLVESRRSGGLRVFLGPTWHSSGAAEMLALLGPIRWGVDPVHSFTAAETGTQVKPNAAGVDVAGQSVFPFKVEYDQERKSYYADLTFKFDEAYFPFIELTLARYQANALPGMLLSPRVNAGIHQLPLNRSVKLGYPAASSGDPGKRVNIAVIGKRPSAAGHLPATRGYRIDVTLEERVRRQGDDDPDLRWLAPNTGQPVVDAGALPAGTLWSGHAFMPPPDAKERRIVIREFELFPVNDDLPGQAWIGPADATPGFNRRLVYADTILFF